MKKTIALTLILVMLHSMLVFANNHEDDNDFDWETQDLKSTDVSPADLAQAINDPASFDQIKDRLHEVSDEKLALAITHNTQIADKLEFTDLKRSIRNSMQTAPAGEFGLMEDDNVFAAFDKAVRSAAGQAQYQNGPTVQSLLDAPLQQAWFAKGYGIVDQGTTIGKISTTDLEGSRLVITTSFQGEKVATFDPDRLKQYYAPPKGTITLTPEGELQIGEHSFSGQVFIAEKNRPEFGSRISFNPANHEFTDGAIVLIDGHVKVEQWTENLEIFALGDSSIETEVGTFSQQIHGSDNPVLLRTIGDDTLGQVPQRAYEVTGNVFVMETSQDVFDRGGNERPASFGLLDGTARFFGVVTRNQGDTGTRLEVAPQYQGDVHLVSGLFTRNHYDSDSESFDNDQLFTVHAREDADLASPIVITQGTCRGSSYSCVSYTDDGSIERARYEVNHRQSGDLRLYFHQDVQTDVSAFNSGGGEILLFQTPYGVWDEAVTVDPGLDPQNSLDPQIHVYPGDRVAMESQTQPVDFSFTFFGDDVGAGMEPMHLRWDSAGGGPYTFRAITGTLEIADHTPLQTELTFDSAAAGWEAKVLPNGDIEVTTPNGGTLIYAKTDQTTDDGQPIYHYGPDNEYYTADGTPTDGRTKHSSVLGRKVIPVSLQTSSTDNLAAQLLTQSQPSPPPWTTSVAHTFSSQETGWSARIDQESGNIVVSPPNGEIVYEKQLGLTTEQGEQIYYHSDDDQYFTANGKRYTSTGELFIPTAEDTQTQSNVLGKRVRASPTVPPISLLPASEPDADVSAADIDEALFMYASFVNHPHIDTEATISQLEDSQQPNSLDPQLETVLTVSQVPPPQEQKKHRLPQTVPFSTNFGGDEDHTMELLALTPDDVSRGQLRYAVSNFRSGQDPLILTFSYDPDTRRLLYQGSDPPVGQPLTQTIAGLTRTSLSPTFLGRSLEVWLRKPNVERDYLIHAENSGVSIQEVPALLSQRATSSDDLS